MNIGFVSTWLERGATHVTKMYMTLLNEHDLHVYARGGEKLVKEDKSNSHSITYGLRLGSTNIDWKHFEKWIKNHDLDLIFFNEQTDMLAVLKVKKFFPEIKIGAYIDYYTEETVKEFEIYDFLICNTKRHYSVFKWHKGAHYIPWGTDTEVYKKVDINRSEEITFFHSMGMSSRKGTAILVESFIDGELYKCNGKLVIHTQVNIDHIINEEKASKYNIEIIVKEVKAPGLYSMGDVYVYPTTLDGLGLTIYEALSSGLPVITTDSPPMNEIVTNMNGKLVKVDELRSRKDGYYWPLSIVNKESLINAMKFYCENKVNIEKYKNDARNYAEANLNIKDRKKAVQKVFEESQVEIKVDSKKIEKIIKKEEAKKKNNNIRKVVEIITPNFLKHVLRSKVEEKRFERS